MRTLDFGTTRAGWKEIAVGLLLACVLMFSIVAAWRASPPERVCDEQAHVCLLKKQDCQTRTAVVTRSSGKPEFETSTECGPVYWRVER